MKIVALIARILLGLVFVVFGLNGFLQFMPMGPMPSGPGGQFLTAMFQSHFVLAVCAFQVVGGLLLLIGRYVPLGLVILGPVLVNILLFHIFMVHMGLVMALIVTILWFIVFYRYRESFAGLFVAKPV
jgi:uncharacterized membrane protein YphA (DoxX/SURF4 family)